MTVPSDPDLKLAFWIPGLSVPVNLSAPTLSNTTRIVIR